MSRDLKIRPAESADALKLAMLIDIAGEGLPSWMWGQSCAPDQRPLDIGVQRACRETGGFSYRNASVAELDGAVVGMLLGYPITEMPEDSPEDVPAAFAPFIELEGKSVGTWYVNALALLPGHRGQGVGRRLMADAEQRAKAAGVDRMSIQVFGQNTGAHALYTRLGYVETARSPVRAFPCQPYYTGDVVLLEKPLA
ncbi:MAG: GNAT family N-acetyltransferase [Pseudomonadota bacterium]